MATNTTTFYPSGLYDPRNAADLGQVLWQNFFIINEGPGYTRQPTRVDGQPTTIPGPPTFGQHYIYALWVDGLNSLWRCSASGIPGTWVQIEPAVLNEFPPTDTLPPGYMVMRPDLGYSTFYWDGTVWVPVTGGFNLTAGDNIVITSVGNEDVISVQVDPWFKGTTRSDLLQSQSGPNPVQIPNGFTLHVSSMTVPYGQAVVSLLMGPDGQDAVLSSYVS